MEALRSCGAHTTFMSVITQCLSHLNSFPAPLSVLGVVGQSPHVHVALNDFWSQDVVSVAQSGCCGFSSTVESERFWSQFSC